MGAARQLCALLVVVLAILVSGEARARTDGPGIERVRFVSLSIEQGLAQATVRAIAEDQAGFLWLGSQDGLSRFDGHEFEVFRRRPTDPGGLRDNHITALAVDGEGALWIGTQSGGLTRRDPRDGSFSSASWTALVGAESARNQVTALLWDARVGLLAASGDGLIWRHQADSWTVLPLDLPPAAAGAIRNLRVAANGDLLVAARTGAWRCVEGRCSQRGADEAGRAFDAYDLIDDRDGSLWVATAEHGVYHLSAQGEVLTRLHSGAAAGWRLADNPSRRLLIDRQDRLWIATHGGVARLEAARDHVRLWRQRPGSVGSLPGNRVHSLFEGADGLLWFGTWTDGLALLDPRTEAMVSVIADPSDPLSLPTDVVNSILADPDGSLWLGMGPSGGLVHFDLQRGLLARYRHKADDPLSLSHNFVQYVARDRKGQLWIATQGGGLNRLRQDGRGFDHFRHDPDRPGSLGSDHLISLYFDADDTLWVSTQDAGLQKLCAGCDEFVAYRNIADDPHSLAADSLNGCIEDSHGNFWVGLRPGGLSLLDRASGRFRNFRSDPNDPASLSSDTITLVFEDDQRRLWIATQGGGLNLLTHWQDDQPRFRRMTRAEGLGADAIGGFLDDGQGRLWLGTTAGLSRLDPDAWRIENFSGRDGAQATGYFVFSQTRLADGRLAFGGLRGITVFDPNQMASPRAPDQVQLTRARSLAATQLDPDPIRLADRIRRDGALRLNHPARDVSFEFSALALNAPEGLRYRHRLEGLETDWVYSEPRRRFAAYTNLPAGSYPFQVQATLGDLVGPTTTLMLTVDPEPGAPPVVKVAWTGFAVLISGLFAWALLGRWRERERAADRLRASEERLKLALWGTGDELWDIDLRDDSMRRVNPLPFLLAPRSEQAVRATDMLRFVHPEDRELPQAALRSHLRGEAEIFEVTYRTLDTSGEWRWLRSRGRIVERDANGRAVRVAGTVSDVSDLKRSELSLQELNHLLEQRVEERTAALSATNERLTGTVADLKLAQRQLVDSEKMAALGGLVAGVAHEINTPLGISVTAASHLQGETQRLRKLLADGALKRSDLDAYEATARESSELILRNLQRADKLVKSFKQVAVDQSSEQRRHIVLAQYIDEILTSLRPALKRARHRIIVDCPPDLGFVTLPGAIYQTLANLLMNSLVHAFEPDQPGEIRIEAAIKPGHVLLTYADNGRGMNEEARQRIFEPFFTTRRGQGGSGLGMHIVFNLVTQALGGSIECDSAPGQGVYFSIRIPIAEVVGASV